MFSVSVLEHRSVFIRVLSLSATFDDFYRVWFIIFVRRLLGSLMFSVFDLERWYFTVHRSFEFLPSCERCWIVNCCQLHVDIIVWCCINKELYLLPRCVFTFIDTVTLLSLSLSRPIPSTTSVPPVTSSLQVPVSQLDFAQVSDALTSGSTATVSSPGPVLPTSYFDRDPE